MGAYGLVGYLIWSLFEGLTALISYVWNNEWLLVSLFVLWVVVGDPWWKRSHHSNISADVTT